MSIKDLINKTRLPLVIIVLSVIIFAWTINMWWTSVYTNPTNVFNRMIDNALTTKSISKYIKSSEQGQVVNEVTDQFYNTEPKVHSMVEISQSFEDQKSTVKRETLTDSKDSYVRLVSINTTQKNTAGKPFDFSTIVGIWGKTPADEESNSVSQLYGQNVAVPYANLTYYQRKTLVDQINRDNVYEINYDKSSMSTQNGRKIYKIEATVKPEKFIGMMKTLGNFTGSKTYADVNPKEYKELPAVTFVFSIDVLSGDLISVDFGDGQTEKYAGKGLRSIPTVPKNAISMQELQSRLQKLQQ